MRISQVATFSPPVKMLICTIMHSSLGVSIKDRRRALGLRQEQLADLAGCSTRFVHAVEHDKPSLHLDKVRDVLEALGLSLTVVPIDDVRALNR